jgi:Cu(I)/Ag(I) efflux system membrane fusion protein
MEKKLIIKTVVLLVLFVAVGAGGFLLHKHGVHDDGLHSAPGQPAAAETIWTCSMHPQIRETKPGKCRLCHMDLIPLTADADDDGDPRVISFSPAAIGLMEIQTSVVHRRSAEHTMPLIGKVAPDETRTKTISAWTSGRIERLYVDYTGIRVNRGDHMVELYSPELIAAQAEYLQAVQSARAAGTATEMVRRSIETTLTSSRDRLLLLGLTEEQIRQIGQAERPLDRLTIYAPSGGIVTERFVAQGGYVQTGAPIYQIADLSQVWVMLDVYEKDLQWVRFGQKIEFVTPSLPGRVFEGRISFISPVLDDRMRTAAVRAVVDNREGLLKPNMLATAELTAVITPEGPLIPEYLAGMWICPMHGEIVKDEPGDCGICGMDLVQAESLGYTARKADELPLLVPASAVLVTGRRLDQGVVYVQVEGTERPTFIGKEIELGHRAGDYYLVRSGLMEGERVVTYGNFKIDSEMQIQAKPSMMSPEGAPMQPLHDHGADEHAGHTASGEQTLCPVLGYAINKDVFIEYEGKKIYFCCPGCDETFKADPKKYLHKLPQFQEETQSVTDADQTLCPVMGNPINKDVFIEYQGKKVYFCCPGCDQAFKADPKKYLPKLPQFQAAEVKRQTVQHVH